MELSLRIHNAYKLMIDIQTLQTQHVQVKKNEEKTATWYYIKKKKLGRANFQWHPYT